MKNISLFSAHSYMNFFFSYNNKYVAYLFSLIYYIYLFIPLFIFPYLLDIDISLIYYIIIFDKIVEFRLPKTVDLYSLSSLKGPCLSYLNILLIVTVSQYSGDRSVLSQFTLKYCGISLCRLANFRTRAVYFAQSMWAQITNTNHLFITLFLTD